MYNNSMSISTPAIRRPRSISNQNNNNAITTIFQRGAILLDVRTIQEFDRSKIQGARHIAYDQLPVFLDHIKNWNMPVIVYSTHGGRSRLANELLNRADIYAINGGAKKTLKQLLFNK